MSEKHIDISTHQFFDFKCHDCPNSTFDLKILPITTNNTSTSYPYPCPWPTFFCGPLSNIKAIDTL